MDSGIGFWREWECSAEDVLHLKIFILPKATAIHSSRTTVDREGQSIFEISLLLCLVWLGYSLWINLALELLTALRSKSVDCIDDVFLIKTDK